MDQSKKNIAESFPKLDLIYLVIIFIAGGIFLADFSLSVFWLKPFVEKLNDGALNAELIQARRIGYIAEHSINQLTKNLEQLAADFGVIGEQSKEAEILLAKFIRSNPEVKVISIINSKGIEVRKSPLSKLFTENNLNDFSLSSEFQRIVKNKKTLLSQVFFYSNSEPYIIAMVPILSLDRQSALGAFRAELNLRSVWDAVSEMKIGDTGRISIVDNRGNLVADSDYSRVLKEVNLSDIAPVKATMAGQEFKDPDKGVYLNEKKEQVVGVGVAINRLNWGVIVEQSAEEVLGSGKNFKNFFIALIFGSAAVIIVLIWMAKILSRTNKDLAQKYFQLESQKDELIKTTKMLVRRDLELQETKIWLSESLVKSDKARLALNSEKERIQAVINNLTDGLLVLDNEGNLLSANTKAEEYLGLNNSALSGKNIADLKNSPVFDFIADLLKKKNNKVAKSDFKIRENLISEISIVYFGKKKDWERGVLVVLRDITREREIDRMKTDFVSLVAHQLRTPLSAIKWILRTVLDGEVGKISKDQFEILEKGYKSNERMIILINDLLDVARIEEGRFLRNPVFQKIEDLIERTMNNFKESAKKHKVEIVFKKPKEPLPVIKIDVEKIELALQNILDNAINYNKTDGLVTISAHHDTINKAIKIKITDTGIGISPDDADKLFNKFFRSGNAVKVITEGSGLGLFIAKNIIETHGGKIGFETKLGSGTAFWFTVPIQNSAT